MNRSHFVVPSVPSHGSNPMEPSVSSSSASSASSSVVSVSTTVSSAVSPTALLSAYSTYQLPAPQSQSLSASTPAREKPSQYLRSMSADMASNHIATVIPQALPSSTPGTPPSSAFDIIPVHSVVPAFPVGKKPLDIINLMSPPEADQLDSFSIADDHSRSATPTAVRSRRNSRSPILKNGPLSPPISPRPRDNNPETAATEPEAAATVDPILYPPAADVSFAAPVQSLFNSLIIPPLALEPAGHAGGAANIVSEHVATRSGTLFSCTAPPRGEAHELVLLMKSHMMGQFFSDRRAWLRKERAQLVADRRAAADRSQRLQASVPVARSSPTTSRALAAPAPRLIRLQMSVHSQDAMQIPQVQSRESHHLPTQSASYSHKPDQNREGAGSTRRVVKRSRAAPARIAPQVNGMPRPVTALGTGLTTASSIRLPASSPEPRVRVTAPNREDKDFAALPDYCPPLATLPERTNNLKVDWKGNSLDLSRDVHLSLLHRDEVGLAASLRLDCATYLTSKRRIFIRRLECARIGKEFRKTDAQQACKIDVNKASKLWTAYEKVGWLRIEHMQRFL